MIWPLIRKEILDQILSIRFSISLILAFVCLIPGTYALATHYGWLHREMGPLINEGFYNPWNRNLVLAKPRPPRAVRFSDGIRRRFVAALW